MDLGILTTACSGKRMWAKIYGLTPNCTVIFDCKRKQ